MNPGKLIISVFKTDIIEQDLIHVKPILDNFSKIHKWNTDLEDCENILRIESRYKIEKEIIIMLDSLKIECIELH